MVITIVLLVVSVLILESTIYEKFAHKKLNYERHFADVAVNEGQYTQLIEVLTNDKLLPLPWVRIETKVDESLVFANHQERVVNHGMFHCSIFTLISYRQVTRTYSIQCTKRGEYSLNSAAVTCGALFSEQSAQDVQLNATLLVYPKVIPYNQLPASFHSWYGDVIVKRFILPDPFVQAGTRPYTMGDTMRAINWKSTARTKQLQVNQYAYTADLKVMIYFAVENSENMWEAVTDPERVEYYFKLVAGLVKQFIHDGVQVGFGCNAHVKGDKSTPIRTEIKSGQRQLKRILNSLARAVVARSQSFATFLQHDIDEQYTGIDYLIITAYRGENMDKKIQTLKRLGNDVTVIQIDKVRSSNG